jgi:hypothetical protein
MDEYYGWMSSIKNGLWCLHSSHFNGTSTSLIGCAIILAIGSTTFVGTSTICFSFFWLW